MDHAIGVKPSQMQGRREQIAPPEAPEHWTRNPSEYPGEEDRRACIVGQVWAAGNLMKRASGYAAAGKS